MSPAPFKKRLIMLRALVHNYIALRSQKGASDPTAAGITGGCELSDMGAGNQTPQQQTLLAIEPSDLTVFVYVHYTDIGRASIKTIEIFYCHFSLGTETQCICVPFYSFIFISNFITMHTSL